MNHESLQTLLRDLTNHSGSDLHLSQGHGPVIRQHGELVTLTGYPILDDDDLYVIVSLLLTDSQIKELEEKRSVDIGYSNDENERFRINIYYENGSLALAIRWLNGKILSIEQMHLPTQLHELPKLNDGLVLMTGSTGSGKSTTLASVINTINETRACHILTIEDPVEFIHKNNRAVVHQREIGTDARTFAEAMRGALREDPDVVLVGEMRDLETMRTALMVAETGHLVFSTLHTNDAVGVIDRMIGAFPGEEQSNVRAQLSTVLRVVITQRLVKNINNDGRIPVNEILWVNHAVAHLIREHKPEQIRSIMETGSNDGNMTLEHSLSERVIDKKISLEQALDITTRPDQVKELVELKQARQQIVVERVIS